MLTYNHHSLPYSKVKKDDLKVSPNFDVNFLDDLGDLFAVLVRVCLDVFGFIVDTEGLPGVIIQTGALSALPGGEIFKSLASSSSGYLILFLVMLVMYNFTAFHIWFAVFLA